MARRFEPELAYPVLATVLLGLALGTGLLDRAQALPGLAIALAACIPYSLHRHRTPRAAWTALPIAALVLSLAGYGYLLMRLPATADVAFAPVGVALGCWIIPMLEPHKTAPAPALRQP